MSKSKILHGLNPVQADAVTHPGGYVLVIAGAGSGKTRILTHRVAYLVAERGVKPSNILAVTFTNKAANEMKERLGGLMLGRAGGMWVGTFHSICLRILKREADQMDGFTGGFVIYDAADQIRLIKECLKELGLNEKVFEPRSLRGQIDRAKNDGLGPGGMAERAGNRVYLRRVAQVYDLYQGGLRRNNALDFGDLLHETARLFSGHSEVGDKYSSLFEHVLVDEYQDTNRIQYELVKRFSSHHGNLFVVGDDSQSIYGWRGADINNILEFEREFRGASVVKLEQNYRSTKNILSAANAVIAHNESGRPKELWTENSEGEMLEYYETEDERAEAARVVGIITKRLHEGGGSYRDFAVFYRTNSQSRLIEEAFFRRGIPYKILGSVGFYSRAEVKNTLAFLRVIVNHRDDISLKRVINVPPRGIGKVTVDALERVARESSLSLFETIGVAGESGLIGKAALGRLEKFSNMIAEFTEYALKNPVSRVLRKVLQDTGYLESLKEEEERFDNVGQLLNEAAEFEQLRKHSGEGGGGGGGGGGDKVHDFLDSISLTSDVDGFDEKSESVTLMTIHSAKGLEFPVVFITGMEENLFPHAKAMGEDGQIEEERRLFYVGLTRAKERVFLTGASRRRFYGEERTAVPSRFLKEIPDALVSRKTFRGEGGNRNAPISLADYYGARSRRKWSSGGVDSQGSPSGLGGGKGGGQRAGLVYAAGDGVYHPVFGEGVVKAVQGKGRDAKVLIMFPGRGVKKIVASFKGMRRV